MTKLLLCTLWLGACGGGGTSAGPDAARSQADARPDGPPGSTDAPRAITGYALTTAPGGCDTLSNPQALPLGGFTHVTDIVDLPTAIPFWDETAGRMAVAEQGQLFLFPAAGATTITTLVDPVAIPSADDPDGFIAPFWMFHLSAVPDRSEIAAAVQSDHLTVQWTDFALGGITADTTSHVTLQVRLFGTGAIELAYCRLEPGAQPASLASGDHAVVGIESPDGSHGAQAGAFTAGTAATGTGYRFTPQ